MTDTERIQQLQQQIDALSEKKRQDKRSTWFVCVAQAEIKMQSEVVHCIQENPQYYKAMWILHDRDKKRESVAEWDQVEAEELGYSDSLVAPHYHVLFQTVKQTSARSLANRFAHFVNFFPCSDPVAYFQYMMHRDFKCSFIPTKYKYQSSDVQTNDELTLSSFLGGFADRPETDSIQSWFDILNKVDGDCVEATRIVLEMGNTALLRELRAHPFFYSRFFTHKTN